MKGVVFNKKINQELGSKVTKVRLMEKFGYTPSEVDALPLDLVETAGLLSEADAKKMEIESRKKKR